MWGVDGTSSIGDYALLLDHKAFRTGQLADEINHLELRTIIRDAHLYSLHAMQMLMRFASVY